jgi:hypothetical protein
MSYGLNVCTNRFSVVETIEKAVTAIEMGVDHFDLMMQMKLTESIISLVGNVDDMSAYMSSLHSLLSCFE